MSTDPSLEALLREDRAAQVVDALGPCEVCGSTVDVSATDRGVRCYAHHFGSRGRAERDHPAGIDNLPGWTIRLDANTHRDETEIRIALGIHHWPDAKGDPLLMAAHALAGLATIGILIARWLVELDAFLLTAHGNSWSDGSPPFPLQ